jgi:predicted PurR-regulated permease PerM
VLWGTAAFLLNYVPIPGRTIGVITFAAPLMVRGWVVGTRPQAIAPAVLIHSEGSKIGGI